MNYIINDFTAALTMQDEALAALDYNIDDAEFVLEEDDKTLDLFDLFNAA